MTLVVSASGMMTGAALKIGTNAAEMQKDQREFASKSTEQQLKGTQKSAESTQAAGHETGNATFANAVGSIIGGAGQLGTEVVGKVQHSKTMRDAPGVTPARDGLIGDIERYQAEVVAHDNHVKHADHVREGWRSGGGVVSHTANGIMGMQASNAQKREGDKKLEEGMARSREQGFSQAAREANEATQTLARSGENAMQVLSTIARANDIRG